jgi:hypothetical protein
MITWLSAAEANPKYYGKKSRGAWTFRVAGKLLSDISHRIDFCDSDDSSCSRIAYGEIEGILFAFEVYSGMAFEVYFLVLNLDVNLFEKELTSILRGLSCYVHLKVESVQLPLEANHIAKQLHENEAIDFVEIEKLAMARLRFL